MRQGIWVMVKKGVGIQGGRWLPKQVWHIGFIAVPPLRMAQLAGVTSTEVGEGKRWVTDTELTWVG